MDLKTFIAETITQISQGIEEAREALPNTCINPLVYTNENGSVVAQRLDSFSPNTQSITFDIAITAAETADIKGGAGLRVMGLAIGGEGGVSEQNSTVSRIKFSLPILWPKGDGIAYLMK